MEKRGPGVDVCSNCKLDLSTVKISWRGYEHSKDDCISRLKAELAGARDEVAEAKKLAGLELQIVAGLISTGAWKLNKAPWIDALRAHDKVKDDRIADLKQQLDAAAS